MADKQDVDVGERGWEEEKKGEERMHCGWLVGCLFVRAGRLRSWVWRSSSMKERGVWDFERYLYCQELLVKWDRTITSF